MAEPNTSTMHLAVTGMVCPSCAGRIQKRLGVEPGIVAVEVSYRRKSATLTVDPDRVRLEDVESILDEMAYGIAPASSSRGMVRPIIRVAALILLLAGAARTAASFGLTSVFSFFPEAEAGMGYGMLFMVGLLTSAHCVAMCGGINLSQSVGGASGRSRFLPGLLYGGGRLFSYTVLGALAGGLGSAVSVSTTGKGLIQIGGGVFMIVMALSMLGVFAVGPLSSLLPASLSRLVARGRSGKGPLVVGLLNGFMPCGPLQTMQLYALSTGSMVQGAASMFLFALGTVPLTMGLGFAGSLISVRYMGKALRVAAVLVLLMGLGMADNGLIMAGYRTPGGSGEAADIATASVQNGYQVLETRLSPFDYEPVRLQPGIPVRWHIMAGDGSINGCNNRILIPAFDVEKRLEPGDNLIEFTPSEAGVYPYMCWMGMIASRIIVGDSPDTGVTPDFDPSVLPEDDDWDSVPW